MLDKNGSELVKGDQVTLTGEVIALGEHGKITVRANEGEGRNGTLLQVEPSIVTKQGDSDTKKAARRGFDSAFNPNDHEQSK